RRSGRASVRSPSASPSAHRSARSPTRKPARSGSASSPRSPTASAPSCGHSEPPACSEQNRSIEERLYIGVGLLALLAVVGTLTGTVGTNDAFQLSLTDPAGAPAKHLDAGTYTLVVHDNSSFHNFHLFGPGAVDVSTGVDTIGD